MLKEAACNDLTAIVRRWIPVLLAAPCVVATTAAPLRAQDATLPPVTVGAGVRTAYVHTSPDGGDSSDSFILDSVRLYVNGSAAKNVKFMFNTEYDGPGNHITVLDAVARFELSDKVNFWAGRFLPPSDRANLYGPYYAHHWGVFVDGVQDGYPFVSTGAGRDNGVAYWGQFDKVKLSGGVFDGPSATGRSKPITAGRAQVDFWDPEPGYYLNGTYYGGKNLLAVAVAGQIQGSDNTAMNVDFLLERKLPGGASYSVESEYARYHQLGGYEARYGLDQGAYILGSYIFPTVVSGGKFEVLGKFTKANFSEGLTRLDSDYDQKTSEFNFNYLLKEFNARVMFFYLDRRFSAVHANDKRVGVGLQVQM
jgi:hypothetical protein